MRVFRRCSTCHAIPTSSSCPSTASQTPTNLVRDSAIESLLTFRFRNLNMRFADLFFDVICDLRFVKHIKFLTELRNYSYWPENKLHKNYMVELFTDTEE